MELLFNHEELLEHLTNYKYAPLLSEDCNEESCAIIMSHFGTTDSDARAKALDAINDEVASRYPRMVVREAYTSRIIMKRLEQRGIHKSSLPEVLEELSRSGIQSVLIQPTVMINGKEMESIRRDTERYEKQFKEIRISTPLLYHPIDYRALAHQLDGTPNGSVVYVGHGTYDASTAQYCMLQSILEKEGKDNIIISTIEGYPDLDDLKHQLSKRGDHNIILRPLMYVAGTHAKEDIAEEWYDELTREGYNVRAELIGLGELPAIRQLYHNKIDFSLNYRAWDIMEKKKMYRSTGEII